MIRRLLGLLLAVSFIICPVYVCAGTATTSVDCFMDARVNGGSASKLNFGGITDLQIAAEGTDSTPTRKSYLKFDLSTINIRNVKSINIELCMIDNNNYSTNGIGYVADNSWKAGEGTGRTAMGDEICFENAPPLSQALGVLPRAAARYSNVRFDVTGIIKDKISQSNYISFVLYSTQKVTFPSSYYSMEYSDPVYRPKLIVENYDYDRVLTGIDLSKNSYILKTQYNSAAYTAIADCYDQNGEKMIGVPLCWSLNNNYDGVSIDPNTGEITISDYANLSYIAVKAQLGNVIALKDIYFLDENISKMVRFTYANSKNIHNVTFFNADTEADGIRLNKDGFVEFDISLNPAAVNYLTVKLDGSDSGNGMLFLTTSDNLINAAYGTSTPELDRINGMKTFDAGYYYSTYMLPKSITQGKNTLRLKLYSTGQATPYGSTPVAIQSEPSRKIFEVYSHTSPMSPVINQTACKAPLGSPVSGTLTNYEQLKKAVNDGIAKMMTWQAYGTKMNNLLSQNSELSIFEGMLTYNGAIYTYTTKQQWKDTNYPRTFTSNLATMNTLYLFAKAYNSSWSPYFQKSEMLDRILKALDFLCIAQGLNGGFQSADNSWIGGPIRKNANGSSLEGFGQVGLSKALCEIYDTVNNQGLLDVFIENDDDSATPKVSRRTAYLEMFKNARNYMAVTGAGHAPNQDAADKLALIYHNNTIGLLNNSQKWTDNVVNSYIDIACGVTLNPYGNNWVSDKGVAMEPGGTYAGGYDPGYSVSTAELVANIAALTGNSNAIKAANTMINAMANFFYERNDAAGNPVMMNEASIGWRNNYNPSRDPRYIFAPSAALYLNNGYAIKMLQKYIAQGRVYMMDTTTYSAVTVGNIDEALELFLNYSALSNLPSVTELFPYEKDRFVFTDETAGTIAFKNNGEYLYAALDFRNKTASPDSITRLHYVSGTNDIVANIEQKTPFGFKKLSIVKYGNYLILMNCDSVNSYTYYDESYGGSVTDLVNGGQYNLDNTITVRPLTTMILTVNSKPNVLIKNISKNNNQLAFSINNNTYNYVSGKIYVAYFNNNKLSNIEILNCNTEDLSTRDFVLNLKDNHEIKIFYFNANNLTSLCKSGFIN